MTGLCAVTLFSRVLPLFREKVAPLASGYPGLKGTGRNSNTVSLLSSQTAFCHSSLSLEALFALETACIGKCSTFPVCNVDKCLVFGGRLVGDQHARQTAAKGS